MLKPTVKAYNFSEEVCGFDYNDSNVQVCVVEGKQRRAELEKLAQMKEQKHTVVANNSVHDVMEKLNGATPKISVRDYEVKGVQYNSHTTIYRSPEVVVKLSDGSVLRASKRFTRLQKTNKTTGEVTITGETHYTLHVNEFLLQKIDTQTVPDSTIDEKDRAYTTNFHGEQLFKRTLQRHVNL